MARKKAMQNIYLDVVEKHWGRILDIYSLYEEKRPIMLFDVTEKKIYAYPYVHFKKDLNERGQASLTEQYENALREDQVVVFVRDNRKRKLVSYSLDR